ncbi:molecular chaperone HtpG, partial [Nonlabens mediterrranea]|nr:molecular chaperone HtpG [Nonlabens mediterrranea]
DHIDNLIKKDEDQISKLSDDEKETLQKTITDTISDASYTVQVEAMSSDAAPFIITQPEFMRRMKEMQATGGGGMMGFGNMPDMYNLVVNANHELVQEIFNANSDDKKANLIKQSVDLAKLSQGLLKGEALTNFVKRSYELIK